MDIDPCIFRGNILKIVILSTFTLYFVDFISLSMIIVTFLK